MTRRWLPALLTFALPSAALAGAAPVVTPPATTPSSTVANPSVVIDELATETGRLPSDHRADVVLALRRLGPSGLDPILARLQSDSAAMAALKARSPAAYDAFIAALVDTVSVLRSPKAQPVLTRLFESAPTPLVSRVAAEGLGRLCNESAVSVLSAHAASGDPREIAAVTGLGLCRTEGSAHLLAAKLDARLSPEAARATAYAFGMMGSTWAWQALGPSAKTTGDQVRSIAAASLMKAYPAYDGAAKHAIITAILMIDDPSTAAAVKDLPADDPLHRRWTKQHSR